MVRVLDEKKEVKTADTCSVCDDDCMDSGCKTIYAAMFDGIEYEEPTAPEEPKALECPICKNPITEFDVQMVVEKTGCYSMLGLHDIENNVIMAVYKCPTCGHVITDNENEAKTSLET